MSTETQVEIQNIRKFGRYARVFCVGLAAPLAILVLWTIGNIAAGPTHGGFRVSLGAYDVYGHQFSSLPLKVWASVVVAVVYGIAFAGLFHLYRLFDNLARGSIYTKANVLHIRRLGLLALTVAVLQIVLPFLSLMLLNARLIDESSVTRVEHGVGPDSLSMFITAGLILLASWIMEVGRQTSDEAEEMRRDGELVI